MAAQNNLTLLDRNAIQALAAQAIGQEESAITYREIALMDASQQKHEDKSRHDEAIAKASQAEKAPAVSAPSVKEQPGRVKAIHPEIGSGEMV